MTQKDIISAWARIRLNDNTIPDEVLDYMKDSAIDALSKPVGEDNVEELAKFFLESHGWNWDNTESAARQVARLCVKDAGFWGRSCARLQRKLDKAERLLIKFVLMKQHKSKLGKTNYYNENQPKLWLDAFDWYEDRVKK